MLARFGWRISLFESSDSNHLNQADSDPPYLQARISKGNLHDHLLTAKEGVANELARSQRDWLVRHFDRCEDLSIQNCLRLILETGVGRSLSLECRCR